MCNPWDSESVPVNQINGWEAKHLAMCNIKSTYDIQEYNIINKD